MTSCYYKLSNTIVDIKTIFSTNPLVCQTPTSATDFVACCAPGDQCLRGGICHTPAASHHDKSGFYIASCNDPTYEDPACPRPCNDLSVPDIVYNQTTSLWSCCGAPPGPNAEFNASCSNPYPETFQAESPSALLASANTTPAASPSSTSSASASSSAPGLGASGGSTTPLPDAAPARPLSTGAAVGIGVGVAAAVVLLAAIALALCLARQRRRHKAEPQGPPPTRQEKADQPSVQQWTELDPKARPHELDMAEVHELHHETPYELGHGQQRRLHEIGGA